MTLQELVEQNYHKLSDNDLHIWQYICANEAKCQEMSIDELAADCHISHTTILRFVRKLGLKGFGELKFVLRWQSQQETTKFQPAEIERVAQDYQQTLEYIRTVDLNDLFYVLEHARTIYVYGSGSIQQLAAYDLRRVFFIAKWLIRTIDGPDEMLQVLPRVDEQDVIIFISLSGNNEFVNRIAEQLKRQGRIVISICRIQSNRLIYFSDFNIPFFTHQVQTGHKSDYWAMRQIFLINEFLLLRYLQYLDEQHRGIEN